MQGQEAIYNSKVEAVKAEHETLLQEAFERAKVCPIKRRLNLFSQFVKAEAIESHSQDLHEVRLKLQSTAEQLQAQHDSALADLRQEHAGSLDSQVGSLQKQISNLTLELKATQDDLAKAKAGAEAARAEIEALTSQRDEARAAAAAAPEPSPELADEVARLVKELSVTKDDLATANEMLSLAKASLQEVTQNHQTELEVAAKARAGEVTKLRAASEEEVAALVAQKSALLVKVSDLEGELATLKATINAEPAAPKSNGTVHPQSPGISKEELQRMHEAHNLKLHDLNAEHDKAIKVLKEELEASQAQASEFQQEVARKMLEIQYLEQDQDENQEEITRYVSFFRLKGFIGAAIALVVIYVFV